MGEQPDLGGRAGEVGDFMRAYLLSQDGSMGSREDFRMNGQTESRESKKDLWSASVVLNPFLSAISAHFCSSPQTSDPSD